MARNHGRGIRGRPDDGTPADVAEHYIVQCPFCGQEYDAVDLAQLIYHDMTPGHELDLLMQELDLLMQEIDAAYEARLLVVH